MNSLTQQLAAALASAVNEASRSMCLHDETRRAGAIWTVCNQCGVKWADDEPKPLPEQPPWFPGAVQALAEYEHEREQQVLDKSRNY